ncbi:hypothetical protein TRFO_07858 [Tritrichomonas foetus]|uniref:Intimal thickness related receptor IRP domain-containing protein n=1 Tax=Tritrichomonas foetus TaxID=1144522 RepID=A0A1J4JN38_9EUKA|nr:hypothetical protein TRFO_07858 [Tritrichomonas foetus]|eukprot:OHT00543.1 hypothetical protein TRFO_07858 [Tritrichomonas foetus]
MPKKNLLWAAIIYIICGLFFGIIIFISPAPFFIEKKITDTNEKIKELNLAVRYSDLKFYHRSITFGLQSIRNRGKPLIVVVSGNIKLRYNGKTVHEINIEEHVFKLPIQQIVPLFSSGRLQATDIIADLDITISEGRFKDMYLVWYLENASWVLFVFLVRFSSFLIALFVFLKLSSRILTLKDQSATYTQRFILIISAVFSVLWIPLPELRYFDILTSLSPIFDLLNTMDIAFMIFMINFICWDLVYRFTDNEPQFVRRTVALFIIACLFLSLPKAIKFNDTSYQEILEVWIPLILLMVSTLNLIRFPVYLDWESPEFQSSFFHLFLAVVSIGLTIYAKAFDSERNSRTSILSASMNSITFLFMVLLHWPRDESGFDKQYIAPDQQESYIGELSDNELLDE